METTNSEAYLESQIVAADPVELVRILYRFAQDNLRAAQTALAAGDVGRHTRHVGRASAALNELAAAVNMEAGGEIARNLAALYAYILTLLLKTAAHPSPSLLSEAEALLRPLAEAWDQWRPAALPADVPVPDEPVEYSPLSCCG